MVHFSLIHYLYEVMKNMKKKQQKKSNVDY